MMDSLLDFIAVKHKGIQSKMALLQELGGFVKYDQI